METTGGGWKGGENEMHFEATLKINNSKLRDDRNLKVAVFDPKWNPRSDDTKLWDLKL